MRSSPATPPLPPRRAGWLLAAPLLALACNASPDSPDSGGDPLTPPPDSTVVESAPVAIRREIFLVPGAAAPANPVTGASAPAALNAVRVVRYRVDADPPKPARAILILMPGFLGGAGSFDPLARALVRRSTPDEPLEAWAIDRRPNLLEDHHGLAVAVARRDPEAARRYYVGGETVAGRRFADHPDAASVSYLSEWGLATTVADVRAVISLVPPGERLGRVVLLGHSLGASIAETYAAWDFPDGPGYRDLASLVLVDGVARVEGQAQPGITQDQYEQGGGTGFSGPNPGLKGVRTSDPYTTLPLLGAGVYPITALTAMYAAWRPQQVRTAAEDPDRSGVLTLLLSARELPAMTNRAALGLAFDRGSCGLTFAAVSCGAPSGGPMESYESPIFGGRLSRPADPKATYGWTEWSDAMPAGNTSLDELAATWFLWPTPTTGAGVDFAEWYFATRLPLDVSAANTLTLQEGDWPVKRHGLRAMHGRAMDLPVLALSASLVGGPSGDPKPFLPLRALLANAPLGAGRPLAGTARTDERAFRIVSAGGMTHIDPLTAADRSPGMGPAWYDLLAAWLRLHSPVGGVVVKKPDAAPR